MNLFLFLSSFPDGYKEGCPVWPVKKGDGEEHEEPAELLWLLCWAVHYQHGESYERYLNIILINNWLFYLQISNKRLDNELRLLVKVDTYISKLEIYRIQKRQRTNLKWNKSEESFFVFLFKSFLTWNGRSAIVLAQ